MKHTKTYMAVDQYGTTHHNLGPHPRKELLGRHYRQHASKMYRDLNDGTVAHVGYIIAGHWFELFEVTPFRRPRLNQ